MTTRGNEEFADLDAYIHRVDNETVDALARHIDLLARLRRMFNAAGPATGDNSLPPMPSRQVEPDLPIGGDEVDEA